MIDQEGKEVAKAARKALMPLWNAFYFFCLYANAEGIRATKTVGSDDVLDRYILSKVKVLAQDVKKSMEEYDINQACADCAEFLDILNNWYIRRSRTRFWDGTDLTAFNVLYTVLITIAKVMAPLMPMMCEYVYRSLTEKESVHLRSYPDVSALTDDVELMEKMDLVRTISSTAKAIREEHRLRNRLPLRSMTIAGTSVEKLYEFAEVLKEEVNVKDIVFKTDINEVADTFLYLKTPLIGKRLGRFMKDIMSESKGNNWKQNEDGTLSIAGQILTQEEYELRLVLKEGLQGQALPDNTAVIQLDTEVVPELEKEGIARDFVRMIQSLRKEKGFDVSDRIQLSFATDSSLVKEAIAEHEAYIKDQVLAVEIKQTTDSLMKQEELGDSNISFDVVKN